MRALILALTILVAAPAFAVQPSEMLSDPALEARARAISETLRCPVCQGETIDDSNAPISRDLRLAVRERLVAGDTDQQVIDYIVDRYGEFVLFEPRATGSGLILWLAGPAMLLAGLGIAFATTRKRAAAPEAANLTEDDKARLADLMKE
jgi:cytochrome c-type biogenesis protein CcmH